MTSDKHSLAIRRFTRVLATAFAALCACASLDFAAAADLSDSPQPNGASAIYARGALLALDPHYAIFTTGDALRLRAGTPIPKGTTIGSVVLVTIDRVAGEIDAISLDPHVPGEIAIADVPRDYVVAAPKSVRVTSAMLVPPGAGAPGAAASEIVRDVTLEVTIPSNTSLGDDVYLSTNRSNYSPSEIRMQRIDARRFTATVALDANGRLKYQYTRGNYATVERDRYGGIVAPHVVDHPHAKIEDTVTRWADSN